MIEDDKITQIAVVGAPLLAIDPENRPEAEGAEEIDVSGSYILPGFVDTHLHLHHAEAGQGVPSDYIMKLWLSHGITSGRAVGSDDTEWMVETAERSAANEITGPRLQVYPMFNRGSLGMDAATTPEEAREQIRAMKRMGADGVKFIGAPENILFAALEEAEKQGLNSTMHHAQIAVTQADVMDTSAHGLRSMEHWYGLPEAMFEDKQIQDYPNDYIYQNEQHRFGEAGRLWRQAAKPGSERWNEVIDTLIERDFGISPTFTAYLTSRDFMRMSRAVWHDEYTMPALWDWYRPNRDAHGSYWFYWTLEDEVDWQENYDLWMQFVNDYKNKGGRVTVGSDSGYIYNLYGFGYVQEMELLREAGFSPLEVLHAATLVGAQQLDIADEVGSVQVGKKADLVIVPENPLQNLHVLLGTGTIRLNDETGEVERVGGISHVVKDGIVYDARELRRQIRDMVAEEKEKRDIPPGPMPIATVAQGE
ncbi:amidohydrolase family protein [Parvularcula oceani]|uniref:amidohydrolase family protein n=1 Tax=Parvularcula oceani TaxID=1247963 RepID=UPI000AC67CDA|nr:amidohydrolase family protein [Parvularcula oceani]